MSAETTDEASTDGVIVSDDELDIVAETNDTNRTDDADDTAASDEIDLDAMAADLDDVDAALQRLADDTYWTDEITGQPIPTDVLDSNPLARRA